MSILIVSLFFLACLVNLNFCANENVHINTPLGLISGTRIKYLNRELEEYVGIPFAEPITKNNRYKRPTPISRYDSQILAYHLAPRCPVNMGQDIKMNEDCLYLNIWTSPSYKGFYMDEKPVMFWLHGRFQEIDEVHSGRALSVLGDVVVVSVNYRHGSFGFLTTGDDEEPGNLAFHDQNLALRWVQDHILSFGGDPSKVTVVGQDYGSMSIAFHILSGKSRGLFQRAIMQSDAHFTVNLQQSKRVAIQCALVLAEQVGCASKGKTFEKHHSEIMKCLRSKEWETLLQAQMHNMVCFTDPVIGEEFTPVDKMLNFSGITPDVQIMMGITKEEGNFFVKMSMMQAGIHGEVIPKAFAAHYITLLVRSVNGNVNQFISRYLDDLSEDSYEDFRKAYAKVSAERYNMCPVFLFADAYARINGTVRLYYFTHHFQDGKGLPEWVGSTHNSDVFYTRGMGLMSDVTLDPTELKFIRHTMALWTDFAKGKTLLEWDVHKPTVYDALEINPLYMSVPKTGIVVRGLECIYTWLPYFENTLKATHKSNLEFGPPTPTLPPYFIEHIEL